MKIGDPVDFRDPEHPEFRDATSGATWGPERSVRARILIDLLTTECRPTEQQSQALRLAGARIIDWLDLEALVVVRPLVFEACYFDEAVRLDEARAPRVELKACCLPALSARQLETRGDLTLDGLTGARMVSLAGARIGGMLALRNARLANSHGVVLDGDRLDVHIGMDCSRLSATGELRLPGAHIGGQLNFAGARLSNDHGPALTATGLQVDLSVLCEAVDGQPFEATGEMQLLGAHIGVDLSFRGARLSNENGPALNADGLRVDRSLLCDVVDGRPFTATGEVRLVGAHVRGRLSLNGARLSNENGHALSAEWLRVDQSVLCDEAQGQPFTAKGEVCLVSAHIGDQLSLQGACVSNESGPALHLPSVNARELFLPNAYPPVGVVDLTNAVVGQLYDGWRPDQSRASSHRYPLRIGGFMYQSLGPDSDDREARLDWLRHAEEGYVPHAYDQLAAVFRRAGRDEDARRVAIAKQRHRRKNLPGPAKAASYFLDVTVGYGYRTWRAVYAVLAIILIGWGVFAWAFPEHLRATRAASELPPFHPLLYSIDAVLPVVSLAQESARTPTGAAQVWYAFSVLAGWLLGLGFVAYFTAKLFRE
jgi:hypothetical protein